MEKEQICIRIPSKLNEIINNLSKERGMSKNSIIVDKLWELELRKVGE